MIMPCKCVQCGREPDESEVVGLYYVQCRYCERIEVNPNRNTTVKNWNESNARKENMKEKLAESRRKRKEELKKWE